MFLTLLTLYISLLGYACDCEHFSYIYNLLTTMLKLKCDMIGSRELKEYFVQTK